jgi:hypothetical protein
MLRCKTYYAAMQTNELSWYLACLFLGNATYQNKGDKMSKITSPPLPPPATLFSRLLSAIDRLLMANAHIAVRNGDLPYFGL